MKPRIMLLAAVAVLCLAAGAYADSPASCDEFTALVEAEAPFASTELQLETGNSDLALDLLAPIEVANSRNCIPASKCCKVCSAGQACGNSCISRRYTCHKGRGCACNSSEIC